MKPIKLSTGRTINALAAGLLAAVLSACGSADSDSVQVTTTTATAAMTAVISLTDVAALQTKTGLIGHSYIDPSKPWVDWSGQPTDISYNNVTRLLTIPAPADGADMVLGVQRYDRFYGSRRYQLAITTSDPQVSALIFLFDKTGRVVPIPGLMGPLYVARDGAPLEFDAPTDAVGFFVQIQSGWQATESATLRPVVVDVGSALGDEFINPRGPWTDWTGEAAPVSYNALINQIWIQATADGVGHNLGVQRITNPLIVGQEYELAVRRGSREGSSLLLFLVNAQGGVMPFFNPDTGDSQLWLAVTATGDGPDTQRFIAPEGVAEMRVQIQSPWNATGSSFIIPTLLAVTPVT